MAVERKYNDQAQALVTEAWARLTDLLHTGTTTLPNTRMVRLTDGECVRLYQWLAAFSPPRGAAVKQVLDFALHATHPGVPPEPPAAPPSEAA